MKLGMQVGLSSGDSVRWRPNPLPKTHTVFFVDVTVKRHQQRQQLKFELTSDDDVDDETKPNELSSSQQRVSLSCLLEASSRSS